MPQKNLTEVNSIELFELDPFAQAVPAGPVLPDEDEIYLMISAVDPKDAERYIETAGDFIWINNNPIIQQAAQPRIQAIRDLQAIAKSIPTNPEPCNNYITGLKIFYGIKNTAFILYYRPVKFCRSSLYDIGGRETWGTYQVYQDVNSYYYYDGTDFINETDAAKLQIIKDEINAYQDINNGVKIRRSQIVGTQRSSFIKSAHRSGDVESVTFSFQEFFALMDANPVSNVIRIWNVIKGREHPNENLVHDLLLSAESIVSINGDVQIPTFTGPFADLSHLCPPSCNGDFDFRLVS